MNKLTISVSNALCRLSGDQRGQAMVEYSMITFFLVAGFIGTFYITAFPEGSAGAAGFGGQTLAQALYSSLQIHVNSYFYSLSLAVP